MQVILLEDAEKLGKKGEIVSVRDGYARNYLFPKGRALISTKSNVKLYEDRAKREGVKMVQEKDKLAEVAKNLEKVSCTLSVKIGEDEKLYGSVTNQDIERALKAEGFEIDKKQIEIDEPIKKLGVYMVRVKLHPEITTSLKVWVVKE